MVFIVSQISEKENTRNVNVCTYIKLREIDSFFNGTHLSIKKGKTRNCSTCVPDFPEEKLQAALNALKRMTVNCVQDQETDVFKGWQEN